MRKLNEAALKRLKLFFEDNDSRNGRYVFSDFVKLVEEYGKGKYTLKKEYTKSGDEVFIDVEQNDFEVNNA